MAGVMSLSIFSAFTPAVVAEEANHEDETVNTAEENDGVPDGHLRVHYDYGDLNLEELGVWFWGDVVDAPNDWPNGKWFEDYGTTDFGAYVDIELEENAEEMGFLINNRGGNNVTEDDFNVEILAEDMDEVWLTHDEQLYLYEPLDLPDNILRVHFEKDGDSYEPWGLWTWGHVANPTSDWPTGAHPFSNDQTGPYGAYIDLELTDDASSIGFLLVNRENGEEQTTDFSFGDFDQHNQIFLHLERDEVYTNPYYVATDVEEEPELKEGEYDFEISGTTTGTLDAENHAVLDIDVNYPDEDVSIRRMSADVTELGGPEELSISPEVMGVTLSAHYTIDPGTYEIPLQLVDEEGGVYEGTAEVEVVQHAKEDGDFYWDESVIYFMLTDRFYDGDPSNNDPYNLDYSSYDNQRGTPQGGDFVGVTENLDYLDELGVNTIWITPIVENIAYDVSYANENDGSYFGYHGYWAKDFEELNPHLGTLDEFHDLIDAAADRDMEIMVDVVLNHPGYGLKPEDGDVPEGERPDGYPTDNDRERFEGMIREQSGSTDETMELADLPDFKTEVPEVREQIVDWQTGWIQKSTTDAGNAISSFRVDTVKHVDVPTWQLFKNELTRADAGFKMIGEAWENNINGNHRYLNSGQMDSLLDFQFKSAAGNLVNGNINAAVDYLDEIQHTLDNKATVGNFLGSHDENGFLYTQGGDEGKLKVAASLQAFAKGQPVIYYGEELGQTGADNWPQYDNRYDMGWDIVENNDILAHYQSVFNLRGEHSEVMARGAFDHVAGSSEDDFVVFSRTYGDNSVFAALNVMEEARAIMLDVDSDDVVVTDHYAGEEYTAADGTVTIDVPAMADGGTAVLTVENGTILGAEETEEETDTNEIPENHLRVHYDAGDTAPSNLGVWYWDGAARASEEFSSWPGEERFSEDRMTDFGPYFDIELEEGAQRLDMLVNNVGGANLTGDVAIDILSPNMNEIWLYEDGTYLTYEPVDLDDQVRIHYDREDADYDDWAVWFWEQGLNPPENWPDEAANFEAEGRYGAYVDIDLEEDAEEIGFLLLNAATDEQTGDMHFDELQQHKQIFVTEGDDTAYNNPYYVSQEGLRTAEVLSNERIELIFSSTDGFDVDTLREGLTITDRHGENVAFDSISIEDDGVTVNVYGSFDLDAAPFEVQFNERTATAIVGWRLKDEMYAYDGDLGAELHEDGSATLKLWSPSADNVNIILYDRDDQYDVVTDDVAMDLGDRGVWSVTLDENNAGVADLDGYYYHYEIERDGETVLALDPYAKSMATWNSNDGDNNYIGKAAIVDPSAIGPELDFAEIDGFEKREDAIIYELHVRDFTSDPSIEDELENEFGTFGAFAERLDYLEDMGVTHVQLLPVMSYFFANEYEASERMLDYASTQTNFNWGYDPHSYFSLTGMYSQDPDDAAKRIEEFKMLIDEIHSRDMGVILDVVYNHTARVRIFEDLEPNYYHFMDADGTPRVSFGGGRLGTTHEMARRILVDSIMHWVEEYKVDGFRFDMMGDHDAESIQIAYDKAKEVNPNIVMIGEGWRTFVGDEMYPDVQPADQDWMEYTESVGSFSDDFRNELKSGFGSEGEPRFITGGERDIQQIFDNLTANPHNFTATNPGDVVPYIAAHDNLTLHDVIAQSIQKDPKDHQEEIHQRIRLGNLMTLTAQGTSFLHAGQEFGRTKQFKHEDYREPVADNAIPYKSTFMTDEDGNPFEYPYFIHDSYDSSDAVNLFDWEKATNAEEYPINVLTRDFTRGMIELRRSTDAFRLGTMEEIEENVSFIDAPEVGERDLLIGYHAVSTDNTGEYFVFVNADDEARTMTLDYDLTDGTVIVDADEAGATEVSSPAGFELSSDSISIEPLTAVVVKKGSEESPEEPLEIPYKDGDEGEEIREMKLKLTELGFGNFPAIPSDRFGSVTKGVVEHFQEYYGLEVTGEADQATLDLMDSILTSVYTDGNEASEVRQLKLNLTALGFGNFPANPSPRYGPVTMRVVSEFQEAHGLVVNGIADPVTLAKIDELTLSVPFKDGDEGPAIKLMKQDLTKLGFGNFPANPSERYGPVTEGVVSSFQTYYGLDVTGEADQETLDLISELLTSVYTDGNSAPEIRQLKVDLSALGFGNFPVNPSQNYGPVTMGVVSDFQEANDLAINGIADPVTLAKIAELSMVIPYEHGDTGKAIKIMKQHLTLLGFGSFPSDPSELFGPVTSSVVVSFQDYYGLDQTGVADQETLAYINDIFTSVFTDGNSAPEIRELKLNLTELGYGNFPSDPSENYGPVTSGVVRDFQEANDLAVNGIADAVTLQKIEELTQ
ncbi:pullulanase [Salipaludibacillus keqinensis]|nr:pullulanase [Salipaludibacillus keqinensis]